jgi:predicted dehydrogenase
MKPVQIGVIGCGVICQYHMTGAKGSPLMDIVAVADIIEEKARRTAQTFGVPTVYNNAEDLLNDERVEAVLLAMPAAPRGKIALRAFAKGKHVLTEKPVAMNALEVKKMIAARGNLVGACCSSRHRFQPSADAATALIASGALGALRVLQCRSIGPDDGAPKNPPPTWRLRKSENGGGILMNWGSYDLDYLLGLCSWKLRPQTVLAQTWRIPPQFASHAAPRSDAETHFAALIRCKGDTVISFERGEYCAAAAEVPSWRIVGTKGSLRLMMTPAQGKKLYHDDGSQGNGVVTRVLWEGDETWDTANYSALPDFARAIGTHKPPRTTLEQALVVQQISDAIYASAARRKPMTIR